ncbi:SRPBCC domain-containing protein [Streptomyces sp. WI04-05B]|uniref:SRPBCC domain-containing protein n=1 Tax=Streptomyces TaxID=1883 RepID=UPI0029ADEC2B|nr:MULTISPECIES: SRPBCC domain-containing protein [unclassified Streptomyces]MDX2547966.1 SRPBCC domain-containing protein [Streptomyces sp. WI04-05B]MDX2582827.1 SRPBCC domain-containing protein [Streptomyces sp. WI04-05A]
MSAGKIENVTADTSPADENEPVRHGSFELRVHIDAPPERVFAAFAEPELRVRWFKLPGPPRTAEHELDFRVGGGERARNRVVSEDMDERVEYRSRFLDLEPAEHLVYVYEAYVNDVRRWVSLVTVRLAARDGGTRLDWIEQYTYLVLSGPDGEQDFAHIRGSTRLLLNGLAWAVKETSQRDPAPLHVPGN